jgi:CubicO group peptidase (beta-lactamase class C family)
MQSLLLACVSAISLGQVPADDTLLMGATEGSQSWNLEKKLVWFRNSDNIFPTRLVSAGGKPRVLPQDLIDMSGVLIETKDQSIAIEDYLDQQSVAGLLIIREGTIVYEYYGLGNTNNTLWDSFSVTKSVTSMLIGAAIADGYIANVDEMVTDYLPRLKLSPYAQSNIRHLLQMSSGVEWNEDYIDPKSDINRVNWRTFELYDYLNTKQRTAAPGEVFNYNTAETGIIGNLIRAATGTNLSTYLSEKIWKPYGMNADAYWHVVAEGLFALENGILADGGKVLPESWMEESTKPSGVFPDYGYFWWLRPAGRYHASGIFGQGIYIAPEEQVVIALQSARDVASAPADFILQMALYESLTEATKIKTLRGP